MKKRIVTAAAALLAVVVTVLLAVPYYMGIKAEQSLQEQQNAWSKASFLTIRQHTYDRGWFSSTETTVIAFNPTFLAGVQQKLPDNVKKVLQQPITLTSHIRHGLFAGGWRPVRAQVDTELTFTPQAKEVLMRFFGNQAPLTLHNTIYLNGSGQMQIAVPKFNYEELSGIKLMWQGLQAAVDYTPAFAAYDVHAQSPGMQLVLADKGSLSYSDWRIDTHSAISSAQGLTPGSSRVSVKEIALQWKENIDYTVQLNDVVNLVTNLQIGAFINPTGSVPPSKIIINDLTFSTDMSEKDGWVSSRGAFGFAKLHYGDEVYGPLTIDAAAEHIQAAGLAALKRRLAEISTQKLSDDALKAAVIQAATKEGLGVFTNDPVLKLNTFRFTLPDGVVDMHGTLGFSGLAAADMQQLNTMLAKTGAEFDFAIPQKLLESFAVSQARNLFTVDPSAGGENAMDDVDETIRLMVDSTVHAMAQEGYVRLENGVIKTHVVLQGGRITLNGKPFANHPAPDDDGASAPAAAASTAH